VSRRGLIITMIWCSAALAIAVLCYFFPLFHITPIDDAGRARPPRVNVSAPVNVTDYADEWWNDRLPKAFGSAVDVEELFAAVDRDGAQARSKFGRQLGIGGACFLFIRGTGRIEEAAADYCTLKIGEGPRRVRIRTGVVVGNVVRDSTGLVDVNQFANSQDFNNLSAELNQRVENHVIAPARERLRVGARVTLVGCARVNDDGDFDPLSVVPVHLDIADREVQP
jgi:predicted lipoprotein